MTREEHLKAIKDADQAYYSQDNPVISDAAYDELRSSYIRQYGADDLDYVPGTPSAAFAPFHHPVAVTSLAKIKMGEDDSEDNLTKWREKLSPIVLEPKYDGLTVVAYPQRDGSYKYVTRGSGTDGEVLPNFIHKYEGDVLAKGTYPIRGEVMLTKKAFAEIQADQKAKGEEPFKNIRNAAAGILRSKERSPYIDKLVYICYDIVGWDVSEKRKLAYIIYDTPFQATKCTDTYAIDTPNDYIWDTCNDILNNVGAELPLDGVVIKTQKEGSLAEMGSTGHHPNNAVAVKPYRQLYGTILRDIEFSIGRTKITPVAIFDPIMIDGTEVTRASIHNKDYFDKMKPCIGDDLFIFKANEIIPQVSDIIHNGGKPIEWPEEADNSKEQLVRDIMHIASKPVLDIKGLSEKTVRKIVDAYPELAEKYGRNILFYLDAEDYACLEGLGEKSAKKIDDQIEALCQNGIEFSRWIRALCVPGIGAHVGEVIMKNYRSSDNFWDTINDRRGDAEQELQGIDGIGPQVASILVSSRFKEAVNALGDAVPYTTWDRDVEEQEQPVSENWMTGKNFVLTGKMKYARSSYEEVIKAAGGNVQSSVNSKTNYLVIADINSASTKAQKARKLGTKLIAPEKISE